MRFSSMLIPTVKETPKDAEAKSHILMLRAGMIRKLASGFYSYLPLGLKVLKKVEAIVREEMNAVGAQELLMPAVHPVDIWKKTGRYDVMDDILMKVQKGDREYILGPTHEEIITELASAYIKSYKDMPKTLYQIQTKFRDEARPRFGVIRSREFIMKDAYSFDASQEGLDENYKKMYAAYEKIFSRCGLDFVVVSADTGAMGGKESHEFMVLVDFGEDTIVICDSCGYSASTEVAACPPSDDAATAASDVAAPEYFDTPAIRTIEELTGSLKVDATCFIKTILYTTGEEVVAVMVRGDHDICEAKLAKALKSSKLELADEETIKKVTGARVGFSGPVGMAEKVKLVADLTVTKMGDAIVGANKDDQHMKHVQYGRDFTADIVGDLRIIQSEDPCPECGKPIELKTSLEIGHVFKLGTKYTEALDGKFQDSEGKQQTIIMGCYGIGVNRIIASAIEQNYDEQAGMMWPMNIAPFQVMIITANQKSELVCDAAEKLYHALTDKGIDVLYDDRDERMGVKFKDAELIGAPVFVVVGERSLKEGMLEVRDRHNDEKLSVSTASAVETIVDLTKKSH